MRRISTLPQGVLPNSVELERPLLVEGEAGCGKTQLAYSVAAELGLGEPVKISVKSTSRARDLLYRVDSLARLQDAQRKDAVSERAKWLYPYVSLGLLGQVIHEGEPAVVLIDEIDKADVDFPNDLLDVLDTFSFEIADLPPYEEQDCLEHRGFGRTIEAPGERRPIVIITSNREKRLPEPFLRRCLFTHLTFPQRSSDLIEIVLKNTGKRAEEINRKVLEVAVEQFKSIRNIALASDIQKVPSTSELIDWVKILYWKKTKVSALKKSPEFPPYWETLFKTMHDLSAYPAGVKAKEGS